MWRPNIRNRAFDRMGERYARLIDPQHFLGRSAFDIPWHEEAMVPAARIRKNGKIFELELMVPGFEKEEIDITVQDEVLVVSGEKKAPEVQEGSEYILEEFGYTTFKRSFRLAPSISKEKVTAKYENGILRITFIDIPKEEEKTSQIVKVA